MNVIRSRRLLVLNLILAALLLAGCSIASDAQESTSARPTDPVAVPTTPAENTITVDSYVMLLDDSYVFFSFPDSTAQFYRQYFDGTLTQIGEEPNFVFSRDVYAKIGNKFYTYITTGKSADSVLAERIFENHLLCIDLETNTMTEERMEAEYVPGAILAVASDLLISRQAILSEDNIRTTFLEVYDPESHAVIRSGEPYVLDEKTNLGTIIENMCTDGKNIFLLVEERNADGNNRASINVYDSDLNLIRELDVSVIEEYLLTGSVQKMSIVGNLLYFTDNYNESVVAVIEQDQVLPMIVDQAMRQSIQYGQEYPVFYVFGKNVIYFYDTVSKRYMKTELELDDSYLLQSVSLNGDSAMVTLFRYISAPGEYYPERILRINIDELPDIR